MVQLVQQELSELSYYAAAGRVALGISPANGLSSFRTSEVSSASAGGLPPAPTAAAAAAGEGTTGELSEGVRVTHGAVLLSDGRLQLSDGRVIETAKASEGVDPKVVAAVKAIRALSEDSSDGGSAAAVEPEEAAAPAAAADVPGAADVEPVAELVPVEGVDGEEASAAIASQSEEEAELQQDEETAPAPAAPEMVEADELAGEIVDAEAKA
jgi:hypothetical protein